VHDGRYVPASHRQGVRRARYSPHQLRYFGGMEQKEIAMALFIHENTVARDLRFAEASLRRSMTAAE
jgi:DNA-binding transcriptional regulator LsrR (DeoR family)